MTTALAKELPSAINWDSAAPGTSTAKVQARVLSSKHLAMEVSHIVEALRSIVQPNDKPRDATESTHPVPIIDSAVEMKMKEPSRSAKKGMSGAEAPHEQPSDEGDPNEELGDDDGWESGTVGGDEDYTNDVLVSQSDSDVQDTDSDDGSDTDGSSAEDSHLSDEPPMKKVPKPAGKQTVDTNASTFLPSLSVGYIRGDSDTDSDAGAADIQPKKNRRGQRARRAIWEKKYGKHANHKKKEMQDTRSPRNVKPSHPSRTAPPKNKVKFSGPSHDAGRTVLPNRTVSHDQRNNRPSHQPQASDTRPLHPSWEAKRKAKEKASAGIVPSQGKKIVFS
ncbi:hypothetical protein ONZ45_g8574 [Pleurotus djamor]|nr:hypothetical protein ONZ45_g8574 [Pleurotus djamor]